MHAVSVSGLKHNPAEALRQAGAQPLLEPAAELCRFLEASLQSGRRGPLPAAR